MWKLRHNELLRVGWKDVRGARVGFAYLLRGAAELFSMRQLWSLVIGPVLVNALLFAGFILGASALLRGIFSSLPGDNWWQIALAVLLVVTTVGAIIFIGSALVVFFGSILSAPFYDTIAQHVTRKYGGIVVDHAWWSHFWPSVKHAAAKLWWYLLVQVGLIILYIVPGAFGPVAFVSLGFVATASFLALDFLDFSFDFHGWTFAERRQWCLERKGMVLGFGTAVFLGLGIPVLNLFIPPFAVVGAALLFMEQGAVEVKKGKGVDGVGVVEGFKVA